VGFVGSLLGTAGGAAGSGFSGPEVGQNVANQQQAAQNVLGQQQAFTNALNPYALQGAASQAQLLQQLQQGAQGQGPNPALAQLNQTTAANTANQAALMAGQRGAAVNPALIARQAAMQGAQNQQQAAGQAATLAAQQQIAQEQMLQGQQQNMVSQGQNALANTQNAANQIYSTAAGLQGNINQANAGLAGAQLGNQGKILGGIGQSFAAPAAAAGANGGMLTQMTTGGVTFEPTPMPSGTPTDYSGGDNTLYKGASDFGKYLMSQSPSPAPTGSPDFGGGGGQRGQVAQQPFAQGGKVPVLLSPGEKVLSPEKAKKAADGKISPMAEGKKVPGKPKVGGAKNDYANDTHKDALEPGSVVLPRSVTQSKDAEKKAIAFIQAVMAKHGGMK